jgi:hypothetical protein
MKVTHILTTIFLVLAALVVLIAGALRQPLDIALAQTGGGYDLSWSTVDDDGGECNGGGYTLTGMAGQPDAGVLSGGDYTLQGGFHRCVVLHDLDDNGVVNISDVMLVANCWRCRCGDGCYDPYYDLDDDCDIDVVDIMLVVVHWGETCS